MPREKATMRGRHVFTDVEDVTVEGTQKVVRAVEVRGGNIVQVEYPSGERTLVIIPAKFVKKLWIKNGSFVVIDDVELGDRADSAGHKVTGEVVHVLYEDSIKHIRRKQPDKWPAVWAQEERRCDRPPLPGEGSEGSGEDDLMLPRHRNQAKNLALGDSSDDASESEGSG
ncbi:unnamed protein product [Pedinophyceae sp. YPF-701]|nr:unnamed protein product [Pedinophyceae sp. YPF-701]